MGGGSANGLAERFWEAFRVARHSADPASIQKAIDLGHALLAAEDGAERRSVLSNLGGLLQTRYHQTGDFAFLQEAIRAVTEAYLLAYESPEASAGYANNIGMLLHTAFQQNQDRETLADALDWSRTAVDEEPSTNKAFYLGNLVVALRTAFTVTEDLAPWRKPSSTRGQPSHAPPMTRPPPRACTSSPSSCATGPVTPGRPVSWRKLSTPHGERYSSPRPGRPTCSTG